MTLASVGQKIVSFIYFTIIARFLGDTQLGIYTTALAFTVVFVVFVDLGLSNVLIREAAKYRDKIQSYLSTVLSVKIIFGLLSYITLVVVVNVFDYDPLIKKLVYISGITMLFDSFHLSLYGVLRVYKTLSFEAIGIVVSQVITLIIGGLALYLGWPMVWLILAFTIPSALNVLYVSLILFLRYGVKVIFSYDPVIFKSLIKIAAPFALAAIFARVYAYIDTLLLPKFISTEAAGWYAIAYKITFAFQFLPFALIAALYPRFSECFLYQKDKLKHLFERSFTYLFIVAIPISIGIAVLANDIVLEVYTETFLPSVLPLQILITGLTFSFISFLVGAFLNACDRQVTQTSIFGVVMVVNICCNIFLLPRYGVVGAASAALISDVLLVCFGWWFVPQVIVVSYRYIISVILRVGFSGVVMGLLVWYINQYVYFLVAIAFGVLIYPIMLFMTRSITISQLREAVLLLKR